MVKYYTKLNNELFSKYGERGKLKEVSLKKDIHFFYDVREDAFIPIPRDIEHIDLACKILGVTRHELNKEKDLAEHLIAVLIIYERDYSKRTEVLHEIAIGASGLEIGARVKHEKRALEKAKKAVLKFIRHYAKHKDFRIGIVWKYSY